MRFNPIAETAIIMAGMAAYHAGVYASNFLLNGTVFGRQFVASVNYIYFTTQRPFHSTPVAHGNTRHPLYKRIDWTKVSNGNMYAVVDPFDPTGVLYLTESDYSIHARAAIGSRAVVTVLARPGEEPETAPVPSSPFSSSKPSSENSPPYTGSGLFSGMGRFRRAAKRLKWRWLFASPLAGHGDIKKSESSGALRVPGFVLSWLLWKWASLLMYRGGKSYRAAATRAEVNSFARGLTNLYQTRGIRSVIQSLKTIYFVLSNSVGRGVKPNTREVGEPIGLAGKAIPLPTLLPGSVRNRVRRGAIPTIRLWLSLAYSYKALEGPLKENDLSSITSPEEPIEPSALGQFTHFVKFEWVPWLKRTKRVSELEVEKPTTLHPSYSAGPNGGSAFMSATWDAIAWYLVGQSGEETPLALFCRAWGFNTFYEYFSAFALSSLDWAKFGPDIQTEGKRVKEERPLPKCKLGKLALKEEAAGKVRVFAIVDIWSQTVLRPVHKWLFSVLASLPSDSSFDQESAVKSFAEKKNMNVYSYDLKNATDRIPRSLYLILFTVLWGEERANAWWSLLVNREFTVPKKGPIAKSITCKDSTVQYKCGQPMGALSSWASMSFLHHTIVAYAAWRCDRPMGYDNYRVLGDDVVIGDTDVARQYLQCMEAFHIPISLAKSYISSRGLFSFASRLFLRDIDLSPMSLREEFGAKSVADRLQTVTSAISRGWNRVSVPNLLRLALPEQVYSSIRADMLKKGNQLLLPIAAIVISLLLVPSVDRYRRMGLPAADVSPFLAALTGKKGLWSTPITMLSRWVKAELVGAFNKVLTLRAASDWLRKERQMSERLKALPWFVDYLQAYNPPIARLIEDLVTTGHWHKWTANCELLSVPTQKDISGSEESDAAYWLRTSEWEVGPDTVEFVKIIADGVPYVPPFQYKEAFTAAAMETSDEDTMLLQLADLIDFYFVANVDLQPGVVPSVYTESNHFVLREVRPTAFALPEHQHRRRRRRRVRLTPIPVMPVLPLSMSV